MPRVKADALPTLHAIAQRAEIPTITLSRWLAQEIITLDDPPRGSGAPARVHPAEAAAIADLVDHYRDLRYHLAHLGDYYAERLAYHLDNGTE